MSFLSSRASAPQPPVPALPKDFQEALDIIFPSADQQQNQQDMFGIPGLGGGFPPMQGLMNPFPQLSLMGQPPPHMMMGFDINQQIFAPRPQLYDTHVPLVPNVRQQAPNKKQQQQQNGPNKMLNMQNRNNQNKNFNQNRNNSNNKNKNKNINQNKNNNVTIKKTPNINAAQNTVKNTPETSAANANTTANETSANATANAIKAAAAIASAEAKKEQLDDLAMLGIDASDVGAGI